MAWEYLSLMDRRLEVVADYLNGKTKNKVIVDLDCLEARLLMYITHNFKKYLGNDVLNKFPSIKAANFFQMTDEKFVQTIEECDILLVFGYGGFEITGEQLESQTLNDSVKYLVGKTKPEIVILESVWEFEPITSKIITQDYKLVQYTRLDLGKSWTSKRAIYIYEKDSPSNR